MKTFLKAFIVSFLFFFTAYSIGSYLSLSNNDKKIEDYIDIGENEKEDKIKDQGQVKGLVEEKVVEKEFNRLEEALEDSTRKNFLILGLEDVRTDVMILASFDRETKLLDLISIPRDTYIHRKGYNKGPDRKINAIYYSNGISGVKQAVKYILNVPIHNYVIVDYKGVKEVVDLIGGVEVDVPFHMKYDDHTAEPPLHIDIKPGRQILDGENALDFIRWRKNNDNSVSYDDGDLGRIKAQHEFLKSLFSKAKDNIITVVRHGYNYVDMDLSILDTLTLAKDAYGIDEENIRFYTLPGEHELRTIGRVSYSYYIYDREEIENLVEEIYNVKKHH